MASGARGKARTRAGSSAMPQVSRSDRRPLMPFVHDGDKRLAFPFPVRAHDDAGMPSDVQDADLRLRRGVDVQVTWPPATRERPALLVVLPGASRGAPIWRELC